MGNTKVIAAVYGPREVYVFFVIFMYLKKMLLNFMNFSLLQKNVWINLVRLT